MTSNVNFDAGPVIQLFVIASNVNFVCSQSTTQQKNYKSGSACKFMFEVISWKLIDENHSCFLLINDKQCDSGLFQIRNDLPLQRVLEFQTFLQHFTA